MAAAIASGAGASHNALHGTLLASAQLLLRAHFLRTASGVLTPDAADTTDTPFASAAPSLTGTSTLHSPLSSDSLSDSSESDDPGEPSAPPPLLRTARLSALSAFFFSSSHFFWIPLQYALFLARLSGARVRA